MEAPQGFRLDPSSGLYYSEKQSKDSATGATVRHITWFDPKTGVSKQHSYPALEPQIPKPEEIETIATPSTSAAAPEAAPSVPKSKPVPSGFVLDPGSKLYYRSEQGADSTGAPIQRVTYYDPAKGTYHAVDYPVKQPPPVQAVQPLPAPPQPAPDFKNAGAMLKQEQYQPASKNKMFIPIGAACGAILLVVVLGICAWQFGWFSKDASSPAGATHSSQGEKAGERSSTIAETYEFADDSNVMRLTFPDSKNFVMTYEFEGKTQTVKGTYTFDPNGIDITSKDSAPGWSGSGSFKRQDDDSLAYLGPNPIGGFDVYRVLSPVDSAD